MKDFQLLLASQNLSTRNALSTEQQIQMLIHDLSATNTAIENINNEANTYTDGAIDEVVLQIEETLRNAKTYTNTQIHDLDTSLKQLINTEVNKLLKNIEDVKEYLIRYSDGKDLLIYIALEKVKKELLDLILHGNNAVYSPVSGMFVNPQVALDELMCVVQYKNGITWDELISKFDERDKSHEWVPLGTSLPNLYKSNDHDKYLITQITSVGGEVFVVTNTLTITNVLINTNSVDGVDILGGACSIPPDAFSANEVNTVNIVTREQGTLTFWILNSELAPPIVTWDSMIAGLEEATKFNNCNAVAFYTVEFVKNIKTIKGTSLTFDFEDEERLTNIGFFNK